METALRLPDLSLGQIAQGVFKSGGIHFLLVQIVRDTARIGNRPVDQLRDFLQFRRIGDPMVSESQRYCSCHESDCGELLTETVVQFLTEPFLLPVTQLENLSFQSLSSAD